MLPGPTRLTIPNCISIGSAIFAQFVADRVATNNEKPGILREFSKPGKLMEFCATSGKIITNKIIQYDRIFA